jgi:L-cysteine desulfidase
MSYTIKDVLSMEVAPALGCTEPSAIALAAAAASSLLPGGDPERIQVCIDPNIYKNAFAVSIPGTDGESGLGLAAALGVIGGDPALGMQVLETIDSESLALARGLVKAGVVEVNLLNDHKGLYVCASITSGNHTARSVIEGVHDNITSLSLDGNDLDDHELIKESRGDHESLEELETWLRTLKLSELMDLLDDLDPDDMDFLQQGIEYNSRLAEYGLKHGPGLGIGLGLERLANEGTISRDMVLASRIMTSAAADARMSGAKLPAMSSGGSGNHGLTAILPIVAINEFVKVEEDGRLLKAVALSHLVTAYVKAHTGRLTAICGCSVAAGAGAAAGVTYLMGGSQNHIAGAIKNIVGDLAGVICDGAKDSCAMKLATAAGAAVHAGLFSLHGIFVQSTDGIIGFTSEQTMENVGTLSSEGMMEADRAILRIMLEKE